MTNRAWAYVGVILIAGGLSGGYSLAVFDYREGEWLVFGLLTSLATVAQLFKAEAPGHQLYHPALIFFYAGVIRLNPALFVLMVIIVHLVEWLKELLIKSQHLRAWYLQPFNISMHILIGTGAGYLFRWLNPGSEVYTTLQAIGGATLGAAGYAVFNHLIVGQALVLARRVSWRESGILAAENIGTDFAMLTMGFVLVILMEENVWLIAMALTPLYLIYRALAVPRLKQLAQKDAKTGLWNAEYFMKALDSELSRASRYGRPLTIVMADLDFLRNINNAFGHLSGDAVLAGVAKILVEYFRSYDVVARFGGEEFAILLPETMPEEAYSRVEAVREAVEAARFESPITGAEIRTTMSFGIASNIGTQMSAREIIHCADMAVYQAKVEGRNRTRYYSSEEAEVLAEKLPTDLAGIPR